MHVKEFEKDAKRIEADRKKAERDQKKEIEEKLRDERKRVREQRQVERQGTMAKKRRLEVVDNQSNKENIPVHTTGSSSGPSQPLAVMAGVKRATGASEENVTQLRVKRVKLIVKSPN